jgi:hypothetical protein
MLRLIAQLDAHIGALGIDEVGGGLTADKRHILPGHQKLGAKKRTIRGPEDYDAICHDSPFDRILRVYRPFNYIGARRFLYEINVNVCMVNITMQKSVML